MLARWPSVDEVVRVHDEALRLYGGASGVRDEALLASALSRPFAGYGGVDAYPSDIERLCCMSYGIVANHPFRDGNKRTGAAVLGMTLAANGIVIELPPGELAAEFILVASGSEELSSFTRWVCERMADGHGARPHRG